MPKILFVLTVMIVMLFGCAVPSSKLQPRKAYDKKNEITTAFLEKNRTIQTTIDQKTLEKKPTFLLRCAPSSAECMQYMSDFENVLSSKEGEKLQYFLITPFIMDTSIPQIITTKPEKFQQMESYFGTGCTLVPSRVVLSTTGLTLMQSCGGEKSLEDLQKMLEKL